MFPVVCGFRHILAFSTNSAYSPAGADFTLNPRLMQNFACNLNLLHQQNYIFDCQMYPEQLIRALPVIQNSQVRCVIDHCGLPLIQKGQVAAAWLEMLQHYSGSRIMFKLSGFDLNDNLLQQQVIVEKIVETLKIEQLVWGSNFPLNQTSNLESIIRLLSAAVSWNHVERILFANATELFF